MIDKDFQRKWKEFRKMLNEENIGIGFCSFIYSNFGKEVVMVSFKVISNDISVEYDYMDVDILFGNQDWFDTLVDCIKKDIKKNKLVKLVEEL